MLYCPHCERPVKALVGSCPHCRRPFDAAPAPQTAGGTGPETVPAPGTAPSVAPAVAPPESSGSKIGERRPEIEMAEGGDSVVDLAFDPANAPAAPGTMPSTAARAAAGAPGIAARPGAKQPSLADEIAAVDPAEVERITRLKKPAGLAGAPLYALQAYRRLQSLRLEHSNAVTEAERASIARTDALAAWGRENARALVENADMKPAIEAALRARAALDGFVTNHVAELAEFMAADQALEKESGAVGEKKQALEKRAAAVEGEVRQREEDLGRAAARLRRAEIELRNLERLSGGPIGPMSPHEKRVAELNDTKAKATADSARLQGEADNLRVEVAKLRSEIAGLEAQMQDKRDALRSDPKRKRVESEKAKHEEALRDAAAGIADLALRKNLVPEDGPGHRLRALDAAAEAARKSRVLHEAAMASVDRGLIVRGVALTAGALLLVVLLLVLLSALG